MPRGNRRRELLCLGYLLLVAIAFRIWILVVDSYNTYLEVIASIATFFVVVGIFVMLRRQYLRQNAADEEDDENNMVNLDVRDIEIARFLLLTYQGLQPRPGTNRGVNPEVIAGLPRVTYSPVRQEAIDAPKTEALELNDISVSTSPLTNCPPPPTCSICLENYSAGEVLIQLPCQHDYHERCISTWLSHHSTCPLCARSILDDHNNLNNHLSNHNHERIDHPTHQILHTDSV